MDQSSYAFDAGSASHPGKVRSRNEDALLVRTDLGLWAVADGMGGHDMGDLASGLIVQALDGISETRSALQLLEEAENRIFQANRQIIEISRQRGGIIGSTVTILLISEDHFACIWAGDSRLYLISHEVIKQISRDHTEVEEMLAAGAVTAEEARLLPQNVITKAIGVHENPELEVVTGAFAESDVFILCSDGLTKHVTEQEILRYATTGDAQSISTNLVDLAVERGGLDNITVVVVRALRDKPAGESAPDVKTDDSPESDFWE